MDKFHNKYRIPSARAQWWDYRWAGAYFITICTAHRIHYFGEIENGKMQLSQVGVIADILWYEIPNHSKNAQLGAFVVMPNHIHGILVLTDNDNDGENVETLHATSLRSQPIPNNKLLSAISPKSNSVSTIIRSYKSAVTKNANRLGFDHGWQSRFHDHVIRNDDEYQRIYNYIENNPENWEQDKFKSEEL